MATSVQAPDCCETRKDSAEAVHYVTRQPILDLRNKVHAYELLFGDNLGADRHSESVADIHSLIDDTVIFGLGKLTCGLPAFVRCTEAALTGSLVEMLPAGMTVLEVLNGGTPSPDLIAACRNLKAAGFRLALDQFAWQPGIESLVEAATYIKVDFSHTNPRYRRELLDGLHGVTVALVAEKVETQDQFSQARDEGFSLLQGFYFHRPVLLESRKIPANRLSQVEIVRLLQNDSINLHRLAQLVKRDASLTYRLLRLVNSPLCAIREEVHSVQAALLAVGEDTFRRMATVAIASDLNTGQPTELLRMAFVRGRFCELAAQICGLDCTEQYLLGLMSLLHVMLRAPMRELVPMLPLRQEIRQALLGNRGPERILLDWLEHYELGDWQACATVARASGLDKAGLWRCYQEAVLWAEAALNFA